ncbi:MHYT domain-containing protein [Microtetraspora sp. NBRC 16547]|uniref:MHYT domain-containing protein n=1 Tax=Microtetraspora sp. NBRC 16547 TaxID=3030993 RepID=UPI0024A4F9B0|nr:MHYT domain-containing protein [Microtetraspora sp. NBRC 16547]GLW97206.1 hypothetical protein Misp02_12930 [Microtetraspora sp. NBRC 16547]
MAHINHFSYGLLTPLLAYVMSSIGSMLGLMLTARARFAIGGARVRWLARGAVSIGGTGIWVMHFIAMMGFDVGHVPIRYDIPLTVASALIAVTVVGAGLFLVTYGGARPGPLLAGGLLTGSAALGDPRTVGARAARGGGTGGVAGRAAGRIDAALPPRAATPPPSWLRARMRARMRVEAAKGRPGTPGRPFLCDAGQPKKTSASS